MIEPCLTVSNQTGTNLYLHQPIQNTVERQKESRSNTVELRSLSRSTSQSSDVICLTPGSKQKELHEILSDPYGIHQLAATIPGTTSSSEWSRQFKINSETTGFSKYKSCILKVQF